MQVSHSRVETFLNCPFKYKLRYVDQLETYDNLDDPANALIIGSALHKGIEEGVQAGIDLYTSSFPILTDVHIHEIMKLENLIPKAQKTVPDGAVFEKLISDKHFVGFLDMVVPLGNGKVEIWDFKYSNNKERYLQSGQIHEYKYWYERMNPMHEVVKIGYIFVPKTAIRQKKTETLYEFRKRLEETLDEMTVEKVEVKYDPNKVIDFLVTVKEIQEENDFLKSETNLCNFCEYKDYCKKGIDHMILPKNERRKPNPASRKKIWLYGASYAGKTTLADNFPNPIMLNTDGNIESFSAQTIQIRDEVDGRQTILAWENFKKAIDLLQKEKDHGFETIVVDVIDHVYEHCRRFILNKKSLDHESDSGYGKGYSLVEDEFFTTLIKLMNLDYNIVLISHEDISKDITRKTGEKITAIRPNIRDKIATRIASMVDIVGRVVADSEHGRTLQFKSDDVVFGGSRLKLDKNIIPLSYEELDKVYKNQTKENVSKTEEQTKEVETEKPVEIVTEEIKSTEHEVETEAPRRRRKTAE